MLIPEHIVDQIREQADIVEIISEDVPLRKSGANYKALSPFTDEKSPSFVVSPDKQIFKDFSSGLGGNVYKFVMEYHKMTFPEAVEYVANKVGIELEKNTNPEELSKLDKRQKAQKAIIAVNEVYQKALGSPKNLLALNYFMARGLNQDMIVKFSLGYSPDDWEFTYQYLKKQNYDDESLADCGVFVSSNRGGYFDRFKGRAMFPVRDHIGRIVGFSGRQLKEDKKSGKYINSPQCLLYDKSLLLYGLFEGKDAIRNKREVLLVEGQLDVISLHKVGIYNVVASSGTALTAQQVDLITRYADKIYFIYDSDRAGIAATEKGLNLALEKSLDVRIVRLPDGEDPDSIINKHGQKTFNIYLDDSIDFVQFKIDNHKALFPEETAKSKATIIRSLIESINLIPDKLQHDFYLGRVSHHLDLSKYEIDLLYQEKLSNQIQSQQKKDRRNTLAHNREQRELREDAQSGDDYPQFTVHNSEDLYEKSNLEQEESLTITKLLLPDELTLLKYALQGFDYINMMTDHYEVSADVFLTPEAKELFKLLSSLENLRGKSLMEALIDAEYISDDKKNLLLGLVLAGDDKSMNWPKFRSGNMSVDLHPEAADSLLRLERVQLYFIHSISHERMSRKDDVHIDLLKEVMKITEIMRKLDDERADR